MPFRIAPAIVSLAWVAVIGAGITGLLWVAEQLRRGAKAEVHAEYTEAARKKNVDIGNFNSAQEALDAVVEAKVQEALAASKGVPSTHKATASQAAALNTIRRTGQ